MYTAEIPKHPKVVEKIISFMYLFIPSKELLQDNYLGSNIYLWKTLAFDYWQMITGGGGGN